MKQINYSLISTKTEEWKSPWNDIRWMQGGRWERGGSHSNNALNFIIKHSTVGQDPQKVMQLTVTVRFSACVHVVGHPPSLPHHSSASVYYFEYKLKIKKGEGLGTLLLKLLQALRIT